MDQEKSVDESWKESSEKDKERLANLKAEQSSQEGGIITGMSSSSEEEEASESESSHSCECGDESHHAQEAQASSEEPSDIQVDFLNYVTGLGFQAMIFLGEIPNPMTNEQEKNIQQAKFLIDTLVMMREKTKGNLNQQEEQLLNGSIYELQMKYVDVSQKEEAK